MYANVIVMKSRSVTSPDRAPITGRTKGLSVERGEGDDTATTVVVEIVVQVLVLLEPEGDVGDGDSSSYVRI